MSKLHEFITLQATVKHIVKNKNLDLSNNILQKR